MCQLWQTPLGGHTGLPPLAAGTEGGYHHGVFHSTSVQEGGSCCGCSRGATAGPGAQDRRVLLRQRGTGLHHALCPRTNGPSFTDLQTTPACSQVHCPGPSCSPFSSPAGTPAGPAATSPSAGTPDATSLLAGTPAGPAATSLPAGALAGPAGTSEPAGAPVGPAATTGTSGPAATTEAQRAISNLVEILLQAMQLACATLPAGHPLCTVYLQAVTLQTTTTQHG